MEYHLIHVNTGPYTIMVRHWQMRHCGRLPYDSVAVVRNGWNGWLTSLINFIWVVGAIWLAVTEPRLGDAGFLVVTVKLPYVTHDGHWIAWRKGGERDRKDASWGDGTEQVDHMFHQKTCTECKLEYVRERRGSGCTCLTFICWRGPDKSKILIMSSAMVACS